MNQELTTAFTGITQEILESYRDALDFWKESAKYWRESYFDLLHELHPKKVKEPDIVDFSELV